MVASAQVSQSSDLSQRGCILGWRSTGN